MLTDAYATGEQVAGALNERRKVPTVRTGGHHGPRRTLPAGRREPWRPKELDVAKHDQAPWVAHIPGTHV